MAEIFGNLWEYNLAKIVIVDVSDDYRLMQNPMPTEFYPVVKEIWMPAYLVNQQLSDQSSTDGFLYDWHESPESVETPWYVGVVNESVLRD